MPVREQRPSLSNTHRSELDRQAISAACHVLLSVVWLERRVAMRLVTLSENPTRGELSGGLVTRRFRWLHVNPKRACGSNSCTNDDAEQMEMTDYESDEIREPHWTPIRDRYRTDPRAPGENVRPRSDLLDLGLRNDSFPLQPESTLLCSFGDIEAHDRSISPPTCATLQHVVVPAAWLTLCQESST